MRVLLVYPPETNMLRTQVLEPMEEETGPKPPLGVLYIAAYLQRYSSHEVRVIDSVAEGFKAADVAQQVSAWGPRVVGISATTFVLADAFQVAQAIKAVDPSILVCIGGPHVDIYPTETIALPGVDLAVRGEGEITFLELCNAIEASGDLRNIPGLIWRDDTDVVLNPPRPANTDLDSLPFPARHLTPWQKYYSVLSSHRPITNLLTEKGCPYDCSFCYRHSGRKLIQRSAKNVVDEMEACQKLGIKEVFFVDDTFTVNRRRVLDVCDEIKRRGLTVAWDARSRVNTLDEEMVRRLKEHGCQRLHVGVEAGTQSALKALGKGITLDQARDAFKITRKVGMTTSAYFMIGNPGETRDDILKTIEFACELDPDYAQFSRTTPMPATELYRLGLERGVLPFDYWHEFAKNPDASFVPLLWTENLPSEELNELVNFAHYKFYRRPKFIMRRLLEVRSLGELRNKARAGMKILKGASLSGAKKD